MKKHFNIKSNYNKRPVITITGHENSWWISWPHIINEIGDQCKNRKKTVIVTETYTGLYDNEIIDAFKNGLDVAHFFRSTDCFKSEADLDTMLKDEITDDEVFGFITRHRMIDFFDLTKLKAAKIAIKNITNGLILIYGPGAYLFTEPDLFIYADMPRWEHQLRFRRNEVSNLGVMNRELKASLQYKRAFFVDWRVCDIFKKEILRNADYILDTTVAEVPKMITGKALFASFKQAVNQPIRLVPFFDPGPWGGQWMKEVCDLDPEEVNFAWCFDCVPEENSLLFKFDECVFETPGINLVFFEPVQLLGEPVYARFGDEFPIRFDFLDTIDGDNLSLQVHPLTEYIQKNFGMHYTQDESYYIFDTATDAHVYLGLKIDIDPDLMIGELEQAQITGLFDAEKHVQKWPVKKHDHILIPAGTIHCSGKNAMVLEISATPYIFTFKLWDWNRKGLDGKPRPINIKHGKKVINWELKPNKTAQELINVVVEVSSGDGWREERTGLHKNEFIETRRHWFSKSVIHNTNGIVNVLNLIEGREAIVESPANKFKPFIVHYAETFIIPANIGEYTITPHGEGDQTTCATIKAFVRVNP